MIWISQANTLNELGFMLSGLYIGYVLNIRIFKTCCMNSNEEDQTVFLVCMKCITEGLKVNWLSNWTPVTVSIVSSKLCCYIPRLTAGIALMDL